VSVCVCACVFGRLGKVGMSSRVISSRP
jgi:hypothetical protein